MRTLTHTHTHTHSHITGSKMAGLQFKPRCTDLKSHSWPCTGWKETMKRHFKGVKQMKVEIVFEPRDLRICPLHMQFPVYWQSFNIFSSVFCRCILPCHLGRKTLQWRSGCLIELLPADLLRCFCPLLPHTSYWAAKGKLILLNLHDMAPWQK